ncbi:MAG: primosomal protein N' [Firmicutes bacterium]|nr:primosomal protein N' [Bacillota bacterium]
MSGSCSFIKIASLIEYMQQKYRVLRISALRQMLPSEMRNNKVTQKHTKIASLNKDLAISEILSGLRKSSSSQIKIVEYLKEHESEKVSVINEKFTGLGSLIKKNFIIINEQNTERTPYKDLSARAFNLTLTDTQKSVIESIKNNPNGTFLLFGVTGSGKTEVYIECIKNSLKQNKTAIMLVPEIALTPQALKRVRAEFSDAAILHSGLSIGERFDEWQRIRQGRARVVIGARSAIFAPLENLGVIIIDEEHDYSYNSETNPRYKTKEIAAFRQKYNDAALILAGATPDVESFNKTRTGEYKLLQMPERINGKEMPKIQIIDMRREVKSGNNGIFSSYLADKLENCLKAKEQTMLFINRRGYCPTVICSECGYVAKCRDCDASLVYHSEENVLKCHFCGLKYNALDLCPACNSNRLRLGGIGTQKVVAELKKLFKDVRILRMDNDTTTQKESHFRITEDFLNQKADILVGTQMIAKGHDFKNVSLVGIIDADMNLYFSDYKSSERTFSLITQAAGRCGRAEHFGEVVLQTFTPDAYLYNLIRNYDYKKFFEYEIALRESAKYPPFANFVRIMFVGLNEEEVIENCKRVYTDVLEIKKCHNDDFIFINKMKSPVKYIGKKFRYQILMRLDIKNFDEIVNKIYDAVNAHKFLNTLCYVEVNPQNLM